MHSMTIYNRGEVVVVNVPFSDGSGSKPRPALIISDLSFHDTLPDVIICPISSQPRYRTKPGPGDCPIRKWGG
jgi:mRNA-degrading endonuclease toxin of MazEF toxin-antitoxin module